jgi:hypothetical protein
MGIFRRLGYPDAPKPSPLANLGKEQS